MTAGIGTPETIRIDKLNNFHKNPRRGNVTEIAASIAANGLYKPIVVNRGTYTNRPMEVLAGNHTLKAMRLLTEQNPDSAEYRQVDCWIVDVDNDRANRIVLADNRTADLGDYDNQTLFDLLESIDHDLDGTGYGYDDLAELAGELDSMSASESFVEEDFDATPDESTPPISRLGDVFELGHHRVLCGDSTDSQQIIDRLVYDGLADCIWTDPPYGVSYVGKTKDALTIQNDGSKGLSALLHDAFQTLVEASKHGAPVYIAHADTERITFEQSMRDAGLIVRQNLVWVKPTLVLGRSDYHYRHEPILYGFTPDGEGRLGRGGERWFGDDSQTTVFEVDKPARNGDHPTMKPIELITAMLRNSLPKHGIVLDIFGGSGSTLVAAEKLGGAARLVELDPRYVDVICRRWQHLTGELPVRDGQKIDFCEKE
ncbi:DNA methyltransferase [uncultured Corynebacterium sp.]|uniref:ParB/RepB/Spo0J family partition protein n=1 Tax=uncultured Corynebacterium sp. TaxID=159447 RepID=UPI002601E296|nr:DNA methyltransferase [uncultured Corynebacterium sp.]